MLISYIAIRGNAIMICVTTSGGVINAAPIKNSRMAYFLFFQKLDRYDAQFRQESKYERKFENQSECYQQFGRKA